MLDKVKRLTPAQSNGRRKQEHLGIALNREVEFKKVRSGLDDYYFIHQALPEIDLANVDASHSFLGKSLRAPLLISPMVGGIEAARQINRNLALAAQALGLGMGVGSERCALDDPETISSYRVRDIAPDILLLANLGAVQLNYGYGVSECRRAVELVGADALVLHLNPLQEALQPGGNTNFAGLLGRIELVCRQLPVPVIVKEVGWGISEEAARQLAQAGVAAIDVAGAGGTSWSEIERHRAGTEMADSIAAAFAEWGIPTAESIKMARQGAPGLPLIASGGIRTGLDVAKALALGADAAGVALPLLKAATISAEAVVTILQRIIKELRLAMFCVATAGIKHLIGSPFLVRRPRD